MKFGGQRWVVAPDLPVAESKLCATLNLSPLIARILVQRGYESAEKAERFLHPRLKDLSDPFLLHPLRDIVARIWEAVEKSERITVYGDYDVDGITSAALLVRVLAAFGAQISTFLPRRMDEGYGITNDGIERCLAETRPQLLIAVDCGTTACREIDDLCQRGVEVIVLDHHQPSAELPHCLLVNPKLGDLPLSGARSHSPGSSDQAATYNLATVGLVFKVCHGFIKLGRERGKPGAHTYDLRQHLDLVAVGTVADVVPLDGENRVFVRVGLQQLAVTTKPGLRALKQVARTPARLNAYHVGFQIGPRLNAMGRLSDALASLELLLTENAERAVELATLLDQCNRERQEIELRTVNEAMEMLQPLDPDRRVIVLAREQWHVGVIGIVAARIMREFHRPTVIIGLDEAGLGKGSCRSIEGFTMIEGLNRCASLLERYGGHPAAAGLSIRAQHVEAFRSQLEGAAREMIAVDQLQPTVKACAQVSLSEMTPLLLDELETLSPFGSGNQTPVFVARGLRLKSRPRTVGQGHLKLWLTEKERTWEAIGFGCSGWQPNGESVDIAFTPHWNEYQGQKTIQLRLVDVRDS